MPEVPTGQPGLTAAIPACFKRRPYHPEGNEPGTIGCWFVWDDGVHFGLFYKESNDGEKTGWIQRYQLS